MNRLIPLIVAAWLFGAPAAFSQEETPPAKEAVEAVEEAVAESEPEPEPEAVEEASAAVEAEVSPGMLSALMGILKWVLGATGLTLIAQLIMRGNVRKKIPAIARPLVGPLLAMAAVALTNVLGFDVDFSILEAALLGTTSSVVFGVGKGAGVLKGTSG